MMITTLLAMVTLSTALTPPPCMEHLGSLQAGPAFSVAMDERYAYLGSGATLQVAEVRGQAAFEVISSLDLPGVPYSMTVADGIVSLVINAGLVVVDARDPHTPRAVGRVQDVAPNGIGEGLAAKGHFVFITTPYRWGKGLTVVDVEDPSAPQIVHQSGHEYRGIAVQDGLALVNTRDGVLILDVSDPTVPSQIATLDLGGSKIAISFPYAFVQDGDFLTAIDIADPAAPRVLGSLDMPLIKDIAAIRGLALVATSSHWLGDSGGLHVVDATQISGLTELGFSPSPSPGMATRLAAQDGLVVTADQTVFRRLDIGNPSAPELTGSVSAVGSTGRIALTGKLAIIVDEFIGLRIFDIMSPEGPRQLGTWHSGHRIDEIAADGRYAFVGGADGLWVLDLTNPSLPLEIGRLDVAFGRVNEFEVEDAYLYAAGNAGLSIIDVRNPNAPVEAGWIEMEGIDGLAVVRQTVYVTVWGLNYSPSHSLHIIDASDRSHPVVLASAKGVEYPFDVVVRDHQAYVATPYGLVQYDVTNPRSPRKLWYLGQGGVVAATMGDYLYVMGDRVTGYPGIEVYNVAVDGRPPTVGAIKGGFNDVAASPERLVLAAGDAGFQVYRTCASPAEVRRVGQRQRP